MSMLKDSAELLALATMSFDQSNTFLGKKSEFTNKFGYPTSICKDFDGPTEYSCFDLSSSKVVVLTVGEQIVKLIYIPREHPSIYECFKLIRALLSHNNVEIGDDLTIEDTRDLRDCAITIKVEEWHMQLIVVNSKVHIISTTRKT